MNKSIEVKNILKNFTPLSYTVSKELTNIEETGKTNTQKKQKVQTLLFVLKWQFQEGKAEGRSTAPPLPDRVQKTFKDTFQVNVYGPIT